MAERISRNQRRHAHSGLASYRPETIHLGLVEHETTSSQESQVKKDGENLPVRGSMQVSVQTLNPMKNRWTGKA